MKTRMLRVASASLICLALLATFSISGAQQYFQRSACCSDVPCM